MTGDVVVSLERVSFTYRGADRPALCDVTRALRRGELAVLMGATGAGKSTLARCLNCSIPQFHPGTLVGSIGLVAAVPVTTALAALVVAADREGGVAVPAQPATARTPARSGKGRRRKH